MRLRRVLIANRGEIAVRIAGACRALGIETVVATSEADRGSLAARLADRSVCIGPSPSSESYLRIGLLVEAALGTGCDTVHPGYGFLSENAEFSEACRAHDLTFVGPSPETLRAVGDKRRARGLAREASVPVVPGLDSVSRADDVLEFAAEVGYPVLVKAAAGGGGRGMFVAHSDADVRGHIGRAAGEALAAFGDGALYVERFIERARHIEVQVFGDARGRVVHFGDRDCSVQRRHQKVLEEAPAPGLSDPVRRALHAAAVRFAKHVAYASAGTVEFVCDADGGEFFFIEMNARIQVEHPVTEAVLGVDLVQLQLAVAAGEGIDAFAAARPSGHAIELRINAESAADGFMPRPGRIAAWRPPAGEGVRVDTHCFAGYVVPPHYDSLLAKLVVHAPTRADAIGRARTAVDAFHIGGVPTTLDVHAAILGSDAFARGPVTTQWLERELLPRVVAAPRRAT